MCMGTPLKVIAIDDMGMAECIDAANRAHFSRVQTVLLDTPPRVGDWVLVHIDTAMRSIGEDEATQIANAIAAVAAASKGESFRHLVADLFDREPQLPDHLQGDHGHGNHHLFNESQVSESPK